MSLTSTALVHPAELERTWKRRVSAGADWPPSLDVPPLYTTMGCPPNRLIRWAGSLPWATLTWTTQSKLVNKHTLGIPNIKNTCSFHDRLTRWIQVNATIPYLCHLLNPLLSLQIKGRVAKWLERWTSNRKVARLNPRDDKVNICCAAPEQGS